MLGHGPKPTAPSGIERQNPSRPVAPQTAHEREDSGRLLTTPVHSPAQNLEEHYRRLQANWKLYEDEKYASLVVPTGNSDAAVHRWFHLKEAYSHALLGRILADTNHALGDGLSLVDPFSGGGTTLVAALNLALPRQIPLRGRGLEVNPFLQALSEAKVSAILEPQHDLLERLSGVVPEARKRRIRRSDWPSLSTFQNEAYFPPANVSALVALRRTIEQMELPHILRKLARVALAVTVGPASSLRRDGRALRLDSRVPQSPYDMFEQAIRRIAIDIDQYRRIPPWEADVQVALGSATHSEWLGVNPSSTDLVLFSPPYPNNIDYTEVYKIELWALGFIESAESFRGQRHATLRSHPSVKFTRDLAFVADARHADVLELINPMLEAIPPQSRYANQLERLVTGYVDDMLRTFDAASRSLRPGGSCVYVVGNSVHGRSEHPTVIASDVVLARLAELAGFEVECIRVARWLPRRKVESQFVRESVVFMRKPA